MAPLSGRQSIVIFFYVRDAGGEDAETAYFANVCGFVKAVFRLVSWHLILKYGIET